MAHRVRLFAASPRLIWRRFADWLGLDRSEEPHLLLTDPARHFREWDRNLPNRYWG